MKRLTANQYITAGLGVGLSAGKVAYKIGAKSYAARAYRDSLSVGFRSATGAELYSLGMRMADERERLGNNDHDYYHFAPKLLEMIAFERGEMP